MRTPPASLEAEEGVLGACLINPQAIPVAYSILNSGDFYRLTNGNIFDTIVEMWMEDSSSVDMVTVSVRHPEESDYIHHLLDACPAATNIRYYAEIVKRASLARSLIKAGNEIAELGYDEEEEPSVLLDGAESKLSILRPSAFKDSHSASNLSTNILADIESGVKPPMVSTGFPTVDEYAHGMHEGSLIILGARPGVGKTCMALAISKNVAAAGPVFFFSMEMRAPELMERLYASIACVSLTHIRERNLTETEKSFLYGAKEEVDKLDLQFFDDPTTTLLSLKGKVRQLAKERQPKLVVVDYLQLMSLGSKTENRREEVSAMSRQLKQLAMEIGVPILALSQLNRVSTFEGGKVDISHLKESGSLEQDADQVWLLDWPTKQDFGGSKSMILKIAKNRNGPMGDVDLIWVPQYQRVEG